MGQVILLDINWQYHQSVSLQHAVRLICRGVVEVVKAADEEIHKGFLKPLVIRLIKAIRKFYGRAVQWSKTNLFIRDDHTCQYCGKKFTVAKLTVDHVLPQSKGGKTTWENTVAACGKCNNEKDCEHPTGWHLRKKPTQPTVMEFIQKKTKAFGVDQILKDLGVY